MVLSGCTYMNIEDLEKLRKKAKNIKVMGLVLSVIIAFTLFRGEYSLLFSLITIMIGITITNIISSKSTKQFNLAFKEVFVLKYLKSIFSDLIYEPEKGLDASIIKNTEMIYMGDRYSSNDYISGKYKGISVVQADVHIEEKRESNDSDGHSTTMWVTLFKGRWMVFDFNKKFKANIQVIEKEFEYARTFNRNFTLPYHSVSMEDQVFNENFRVYAQDEHEAFYILTPSFMEKIKTLSNRISGKIMLCFVDNKLHIAIQNNKYSLEHSVFQKINEGEIIQEISKDIKLITDFVDELDLDNDLFRKEV